VDILLFRGCLPLFWSATPPPSGSATGIPQWTRFMFRCITTNCTLYPISQQRAFCAARHLNSLSRLLANGKQVQIKKLSILTATIYEIYQYLDVKPLCDTGRMELFLTADFEFNYTACCRSLGVVLSLSKQ
jgi:hypothetical protein